MYCILQSSKEGKKWILLYWEYFCFLLLFSSLFYSSFFRIDFAEENINEKVLYNERKIYFHENESINPYRWLKFTWTVRVLEYFIFPISDSIYYLYYYYPSNVNRLQTVICKISFSIFIAIIAKSTNAQHQQYIYNWLVWNTKIE